MRSASVSSPLENTQALNGLMLGPAVRKKPKTSLPTRSASPTTAPPTARPCPSRYLVAECTTISAPSANGFCKAGVQKQLSTTSKQSCAWASSASFWISPSSMSGLEGVSTNNIRVFGWMAASQAAKSAKVTKLVSTPKRGRILENKDTVVPNTDEEQTM